MTRNLIATTLFTLTSFFSFGQAVNRLEPTALMKHETKWLVQALEQAHYNKVSLSDLNQTKFLNSYLSKLDPQKLYFTKQDIDKFHQNITPNIITYFRQGNLFPAFDIFNVYQQKSISLLEEAVLKLDQQIDLNQSTQYLYDRSEAEWSDTVNDLSLVWQNLISHEIIHEILNSIDANDTSLNLQDDDFDKLLSDSRQLLKDRYIRWKKNIAEFEPGDVQELYLTAFTQVFDPHTTFMNLKEKEKFDQAMNNEFVGIGAVLTDNDGYCTIKELLPGGPAEASRELEPEDIILKVAQSQGGFVDVVDMKLSKIVELIKGPKDTIVRLEIKPIKTPSSTKIVSILRDRIKLTGKLAKASVHDVQHNGTNHKLGVIELPSFYGSSGNGPKATEDVEELIIALKKSNIEGLILDLRRNGGGYLSEAVNLAGLFISRGPVVQVKSTDGKIRKKFDFNPKLSWNKPLLILISRYSASASEIVAGALKNHKRALIVGDSSTHGKGTVQSLLQMNIPYNFMSTSKKGSAAKITIQKYYLPSGESTQIYGVKSDISIPSINELLPIGESDLENALPWDSIPSVNHRRPDYEFVYNEVELDYVLQSSLERQKELDEFKYINKNISIFKEKKEKNKAVLNLQNRFEERLLDSNISSTLSKTYESFKGLSFPQKKVTLKIVMEQQEKSKAARGISSNDSNISSEMDYTVPENHDIRLHESFRIMADWITFRNDSKSAFSTKSQDNEI